MRFNLSSIITRIATCGVAAALVFGAATLPTAAHAEGETSASESDGELRLLAERAVRASKARQGNRPHADISFQKKGGTDYSGQWEGRYILVKTDCTGFNPSFLFRHQIQLLGNQVQMATTHDGVLTGMSRKGGKRLEVATQYVRSNGQFVQAVVVYDNNKGSSAATGIGVRITGARGMCTASYGAYAIRRFGF